MRKTSGSVWGWIGRVAVVAAGMVLPIAFSGCGAGTAAAPPVTTRNLAGNWEVIVDPILGGPLLPAPIADFTGALQSNNGVVTGTFRVFVNPSSSNCPSVITDLPVTGTIDAANNLSLSVPLSGGVATITAVLAQNLDTLNPGSYQVTGGTCAASATPVDVIQFPSLTGTYTGTLTSPAVVGNVPVTSTVTAVITESSSADADGRFPLTGSVTAPGVCAGALPLAPEVVSGNGLFPTAGGFLAPAAVIAGAVSLPLAASIQATVEFFGTTTPEVLGTDCSAGLLQGTLTRQ